MCGLFATVSADQDCGAIAVWLTGALPHGPALRALDTASLFSSHISMRRCCIVALLVARSYGGRRGLSHYGLDDCHSTCGVLS